MNDATNLASHTAAKIDQFADRATSKADDALAATRRATTHTLDRLQDSVDDLRRDTPGALSRVAAQVDEMTRRGIERARSASVDMRHMVERTGDRTVGYIKDQPLKSVLIAAATGAVVAGLISLFSRDRNDPR